MRQRLRLLVLLAVIVVIAAVLWTQSPRPPAEQAAQASEAEWPSLRVCVADTLQQMDEKRTASALWSANEFCYAQLHGQGLLNDFRIRRLKFTQQAYDERILLWMVVLVTLSGVALAGVQLLASYQLATRGVGSLDQPNELSVERGKLSLKSSVTGLLILVCSFAFFWVFVYEIYVIHTVGEDGARKGDAAAAPTAQQTAAGGIQPAGSAASAASAPGAVPPAAGR